MKTKTILAELALVHQHLLNTAILPAIPDLKSESKYTSGFYGDKDGYCVDGYAIQGDKNVTFSLSFTEDGLKTSLFYQETGKKIPCVALSGQLNAAKAYLSKQGIANACKFENRVLSAFNDVYCGLLLNKSKYKEMPMFSPDEDDGLNISHYVDLGKADYLALLTLAYNTQSNVFEFYYTSDDEDEGDQCEVILEEDDVAIVKQAISELTPHYRSALIEHGILPRFSTLEFAVIDPILVRENSTTFVKRTGL